MSKEIFENEFSLRLDQHGVLGAEQETESSPLPQMVFIVTPLDDLDSSTLANDTIGGTIMAGDYDAMANPVGANEGLPLHHANQPPQFIVPLFAASGTPRRSNHTRGAPDYERVVAAPNNKNAPPPNDYIPQVGARNRRFWIFVLLLGLVLIAVVCGFVVGLVRLRQNNHLQTQNLSQDSPPTLAPVQSLPRPPVNGGGAPSSANNVENPSLGPMAIAPSSQPNQPPITPPPSIGTVPIPPSPSPTRFKEETLAPPEDEEPPSGSPPTGHAPISTSPNSPPVRPTSAPVRPTSPPAIPPTPQPVAPNGTPPSATPILPVAPTHRPVAPTPRPVTPTPRPFAPTIPPAPPTPRPVASTPFPTFLTEPAVEPTISAPIAIPTQPTGLPTQAPVMPPSSSPVRPTRAPLAPISVPTRAPLAPISVPTRAPLAPISVPTRAPTVHPAPPTPRPVASTPSPTFLMEPPAEPREAPPLSAPIAIPTQPAGLPTPTSVMPPSSSLVRPTHAPLAPISVEDIPYPDFRFVAWRDSKPLTHALATVLGYNRSTWNIPGTNGIESLSYETIELTLDGEILEAINDLEFTEPGWDCWVNHYFDYDWVELEQLRISDAFVALGWDIETWVNENEDSSPDTESKHWCELTVEERIAARRLCYNQELWDHTTLSAPIAIPTQPAGLPAPTIAPSSSPVTPAHPPLAPISIGDIPYPGFRFVAWRDAEPLTRALATVLGYSRSTWNIPGTNGIESLSYETIELTLDGEILEAINDLEFTEPGWDCWVNHYFDYDWVELEQLRISDAFVALGWDIETWVNENEDSSPDTESKHWCELTVEERIAARRLCYNQELWDHTTLSAPIAIPTQPAGLPAPTIAPSSSPVTPAHPPLAPISIGDIPYPGFRFVAWRDAKPLTRALATVLGYSRSTWNIPGTNGIESLSYETIELTLDGEILEAINDLEFTEPGWDCWVNHYFDYDWVELEQLRISDAFVALGWKSETWVDENEDSWPDTESKHWFELTVEERIAARRLCYNQELWDKIRITAYWGTP
jgi:hypothetical protein